MAVLITKERKSETKFNMVRLQLYLHNFFNDLNLANSYLDCASCLAIYGYDEDFYKRVVDRGVFRSEQAVRNCMSKLREASIAIRDEKIWRINPEIALGVDDVILFQLKAKNDPE